MADADLVEPTNNRHLDRLSSAGLRAVAAEPRAEIRGNRVEVAERAIGIVVPYLAVDLATIDHQHRRGITDSLGLRVRYSDRDLHLSLSPTEPLERVVFDIAEQFRCEALAGPQLRGLRANLATAFEQWTERAQAERLTETGVGLLIFTVTHMLRYRLLGIATSEHVDDIIETTRGNLGRLVGHALKPLPSLVDDQAAYAEPAAEIARLVAEMAGDAAESLREASDDDERHRLLVPLDWETLDHEIAGGTQRGAADADANYRVFTTVHDVEVAGSSLYRQSVLRAKRAELEDLRAAQAVSVARVAQRLRLLFASRRFEGWHGGHDDGQLDPARLAHIVANPGDEHIYRQPVERPATDAVVSFLIDTSGSMKAQRYQSIAVLVDTLTRALEMADVSSEVLGFTTASWGGGRSRADWVAAGRPENPGRLADVSHIIYKSADQSWRQSRFSTAAMLRTEHYREGLDGEALRWAAGRLAARPERRRVLVLISDGIPMETSTAGTNPDGYLTDHLRSVWQQIDHPHLVELGAITLEHDLSGFASRSVHLDLAGTLSVGTYDVLHRLFAQRR